MKFQTINNMLCRMVEPTPLTEKSQFPCVVRLIQDDSPMGRYNKWNWNGLTELIHVRVLLGLPCDNMIPCIEAEDEDHISHYEIIGYPVEDGSAEWAWQMLMLGIPVSHPAEGEFQDTHYTKEGFVRCMAKIGWQIYEPKPKAEPLLADAKVGDLCRTREGDYYLIKYVDTDPIRYAYERKQGNTIYVRDNGMFNMINHKHPFDIISTEPLATEGTAEWALQMMKLGKTIFHPIDNPIHPCRIIDEKVVCGYCGVVLQLDRWTRSCQISNGWQLYEPKQEPAFNVGDWVTDGIVTGYLDRWGLGMAWVKTQDAEYHIDLCNLRKLDPSEVKVTLTLEGTVSEPACDGSVFLLWTGSDPYKHASVVQYADLDPATRSLVESLLKENK